MDYISLFSGIEAATVAWEPLGWNPVAFAEVEPFPSAVLAARWPGVPNLGDVTRVDWSEWNGRADLVIGGSPCQSFSIAGLRKGLADPRGNLMLEYLRACYEIDPEWVVWENVPGVLSADGRRAFQAFLEAVVDLWPRGGVCWRVLDAQFFGVAQRRRRVFAVVNTRDWRRALAVLQEPEDMFGDNPPSREKRQELARTAGYRAPRHLRGRLGARPPEHAGVAGFKYHQGSSAGSIGYQAEQSPTLSTDHMPAVIERVNTLAFDPTAITSPVNGNVPRINDAHHTLQAGAHTPLVCIQTANTGANGSNVSDDEVAYTLDGANGNAVCYGFIGEHGGETACAVGAEQAPCATATHVPSICLQGSLFGRSEGNGPEGMGVSEDLSYTLNTFDRHAVVCMADDNGKAAVDRDMCGSIKVGGGVPTVCSPLTEGTTSAPSAPETARESTTSTSRRES